MATTFKQLPKRRTGTQALALELFLHEYTVFFVLLHFYYLNLKEKSTCNEHFLRTFRADTVSSCAVLIPLTNSVETDQI